MSEFDVLCCRPEYFAVVDTDNAYQEEGLKKWLQDPNHWKRRLLATWDEVAAELEKRGARLIKIPPHRDLPDQGFAADPIVMSRLPDGRCAIVPSSMNSPNRQQEVRPALEALRKNGFSIDEMGDRDYIKHEGTGDLLYLPGHNFYVQGYGPRSESGIGLVLSFILNEMVVEVPLNTERKSLSNGLKSKNTKGFHLDTLIMPLPDKKIIACFERMPPETREFFENLYPPHNRIELTPEQADFFITNGLCVSALPNEGSTNGHTLFLPDRTPQKICKKLNDWGFGIKTFDFEPSKLSGGGLHCMFNFIFEANRGSAKVVTSYDAPNERGFEKWCDFIPPLSSAMRPMIKFHSPRQRFERSLMAA